MTTEPPKVMGPRVWIVGVGEPLIGSQETRSPHRAGQTALWLHDAGWDVTWWTSGFDHFRRQRFSLAERQSAAAAGPGIVWMDGIDYHRNVSIARELNHTQLAFAFAKAARHAPPPDVIALSFPPIELAAAVARYATARNVPLVIDVRDLWPDVFVWAAPQALRPLVRLATAPLRAATAWALRRASSIIGVSTGYLDWGLRLAARPQGALDGVVPLFGPPVARANPDPTHLPPGIDPSRTIVSFVGTFGRSYDLQTVLEAARGMSPAVAARLQIVIAGDGANRPELVASVAGLEHVVMTGWLDQQQVAALLSVTKIGLAAYAPGALQSVPNKIVDYLSWGLPILSSLDGECAELLQAAKAGWSYPAGHPDKLSARLEALLEDPTAITHTAAAARALFDRDFSPVVSKQKYQRILEAVAAKHPR